MVWQQHSALVLTLLNIEDPPMVRGKRVVAVVAGAREVESVQTTERSLEGCLLEDGEVSWRLVQSWR